MCSNANIAVLILAAGGSKRMGTAKQLLPWGDSTLLGHAVDTASQLSCDKVALVLGAYYEEIKETIADETVHVIKHAEWEKGLGTSIAWGVSQLLQSTPEIDGVLIMLGDQPLLNSDYLSGMIDEFELGKEQIIATSYGNLKKGVPALFDATYFNNLTALHGDKGAKDILQKYESNVQLFSGEGRLSDIDTIEEYRALYAANHQW